MADQTSQSTERYVGDNDPIKLAVSDDGVLRADLPAATLITIRHIGQGGAGNFSGTTGNSGAAAIDPPDDDTWNLQYNFAVGDTVAAGTFHTYTTVVNGGATATYGPTTLTIKSLT